MTSFARATALRSTALSTVLPTALLSTALLSTALAISLTLTAGVSAQATDGQTKSKAVEGILEDYLDYDDWVVRGVREAIASSERGESVSHAEAMRRIRADIAARRRARRKAA